MFGFNKSDVNMYLMKLQQEYTLKEQELLKKVEDLEKENSDINKKVIEIEKELQANQTELYETRDELNRVNGEFAYLKGKEQEIEEMSESIGTMYMVAMQNANEIVSDAEACAKEITDVSAMRLEAATKAEEQLNAIKESIKASADRLAEDITSMSLSLEGPKNRLAAQLEAGAKKIALPEISTEFKDENA